ncbi:MAG: hypothetical protein A3J79_12080 [Elusimicrobia bacterium RIFOXYB2_FULL_62_6]|nr:MAG: hypothetical protein A3J79_12080 [Elusimicrobia bacterium RIFOXYB2_FULL_62_6]
MDISSVIGSVALIVLIVLGITTGQIPSIVFNFHSVFVVMGGVAVTMLISTPIKLFMRSLASIKELFSGAGDLENPEPLVQAVVQLAEQARARGMMTMKDADPNIAGGFLKRVATAAMEYNDSKFVKEVIEDEINKDMDAKNEIINFYRTMGLLAPMFGLIGTLLGIISVLKELSNPETIGPSMALAISSALYGIGFANIICIPIAGKLRARAWLETNIKGLVLTGILEIMKGSVPLIVERRLQVYLSEKK